MLCKPYREKPRTIPPGCGSPVSCGGVRSVHQRQTECTPEKRSQWTLPLECKLAEGCCAARSEVVPMQSRDGLKNASVPPQFHGAEVGKLRTVVRGNGLKDFRKPLAVRGLEFFYRRFHGSGSLAGDLDSKVVLDLQQSEDDRLLASPFVYHGIAFPRLIINAERATSGRSEMLFPLGSLFSHSLISLCRLLRQFRDSYGEIGSPDFIVEGVGHAISSTENSPYSLALPTQLSKDHLRSRHCSATHLRKCGHRAILWSLRQSCLLIL